MFSRREFCVVGLTTALLPSACIARQPAASGGYRSILVNGLAPATVEWAGREWRCNMGATWNQQMDYCLKVTDTTARFEIRPTERDHSSIDRDGKLRSELSGSLPKDHTRLPNGVPLWGAMTFIHHNWSDPEGMAKLYGGLHGQIHIGSSFGGSPALAFRRTRNGEFEITTRGELDPVKSGTVRYTGPLTFDEPHDLVFEIVLDPTHGSARVWIDGKQVVDARDISIGSHFAESYWCIGCYYGAGASCPVVAEFANHVYPATAELTARTRRPAVWPRA
jgi:hypothetical protein